MRPPRLVLIAAVAHNGAIGRNDGLPWRLPGDLKHFRAATMGKPVIFGRRTWASLGRPLPGRHPIVVTKDPGFALPQDVVRAADPGEAIGRAAEIAARCGAEAVMVAGGAAIYAALIDVADALDITEVDLAPEADAFFPPIDPAVWAETSRVPQAQGERDDTSYSFVTYRRR